MKQVVHIAATMLERMKVNTDCISMNFNVSPCIFYSIIDKHQHMHFTFHNILVYNAEFNVKIYKNT